jgi:hypothetical protein
LKWVFEVKCDE